MKSVSSYDIVLAGRGGQGVIYLSKVMGLAALLQGMGVRTTETHGMAMRGGSVQCFVRIGETSGPLFTTGSAALLMALHPDETALAQPLLSKDGTVLVNEKREERLPAVTGGDFNVIRYNADAVAARFNNPRSANLALLGSAVALIGNFPLRAGYIEEAIAGSGPEALTERNLEIFRAGVNENS